MSKTKLGAEYFAGVDISLKKSTLTVSNPQTVVGDSVTVLLSLKDGSGDPYVSTLPVIGFSALGGTSSGTLSSVANNGDGTYSATFTGVSPGSATTLHATINDEEILGTLPTLQVNVGSYDYANSVVEVSGATVNSGSTITATLTVRDSSNTQLTDGGLAILFSYSGGTSTGTFSSVTDHLDGTYTATFTGVTAGTATSISATIAGNAVTSSPPTVTVGVGPEASISVSSGSAQTRVAGAALTSPLVAVVKDSNNNVKSGVTVSWAVTGGGGSVSACTTTTDASGLVQCNLTTGTTAGTNTVTASVAGIATPATFTATGTVGVAASITVLTGSAQTAISGSVVTSPLVAVVKDSNNNVKSGVTVSWAVTAGGGSVSACTTTTDASGLVQCNLTTGTTAGTNTVTASVAGIATPATFTATGTVGDANSIAVSSGNNQTGAVGTNVSLSLVAVVKDSNNNLKAGATVAWAIVAGAGSLPSCTTTTNASGLAQCTLQLGAATGVNTVTASVAGVATPATFNATAEPYPALSGLSNDGTYKQAKTWTWGCSTTCTYRYATDSSATWTPSGAFDATTTASLGAGTGTYYIHVQAQDTYGNLSVVNTVSVALDNTAPTFASAISVTSNDGTPARARTATWTAATDADSGISRYTIALGTTSGGDEVVSWTSIGSVLSYRMTDGVDSFSVTLAASTNYYISVRAIDAAYNATTMTSAAFTIDNKYYCTSGKTCPAYSAAWNTTTGWGSLYTVMDANYNIPVKVNFGAGGSNINGHIFASLRSSSGTAVNLIGLTGTNISISATGVGNGGVTYAGSNGVPADGQAALLATGIAYRNFVTNITGLVAGGAYYIYVPLYGWNESGRRNNLTPSDGGSVLAYTADGTGNYLKLIRYGFIADSGGGFSLTKDAPSGSSDGICFHGIFVVRAQASY